MAKGCLVPCLSNNKKSVSIEHPYLVHALKNTDGYLKTSSNCRTLATGSFSRSLRQTVRTASLMRLGVSSDISELECFNPPVDSYLYADSLGIVLRKASLCDLQNLLKCGIMRQAQPRYHFLLCREDRHPSAQYRPFVLQFQSRKEDAQPFKGLGESWRTHLTASLALVIKSLSVKFVSISDK